MGLDSVELVLEVEEAFGIRISDDEACGVRTVGDLYELVKLRTNHQAQGNEPCLSSATFRLIRSTAASALAVDAARTRPRDRLESLVPRNGCRDHWLKLQSAVGLHLPPLSRPAWMTISMKAGSVCIGILSTYVVVMSPVSPAAAIVGLVAGFLAYSALVQLTSPLAVNLPKTCTTFRDLTNAVIARNFSALSIRFKELGSEVAWHESLWQSVVAIVVDQLGVEPELVTRDARFVQDLGID